MTFNMKLGEVACADIVTKLKQYMPGRVAGINAEKNDSTILEAPSDLSYFTGRVADFPVTPAVFVMEGPTRFRNEGSHGMIAEMQVLIYIFESDQTGPQLATRLQRQARAVIESLFDDEPMEKTENSYNVVPMKTIPGSVFKPDEADAWRGFYVVVFKVEQLEI